MNGNGNPVKMKHDTHFPAPVDLQVFLKQEKSFGADAARRPRQPGRVPSLGMGIREIQALSGNGPLARHSSTQAPPKPFLSKTRVFSFHFCVGMGGLSGF